MSTRQDTECNSCGKNAIKFGDQNHGSPWYVNKRHLKYFLGHRRVEGYRSLRNLIVGPELLLDGIMRYFIPMGSWSCVFLLQYRVPAVPMELFPSRTVFRHSVVQHCAIVVVLRFQSDLRRRCFAVIYRRFRADMLFLLGRTMICSVAFHSVTPALVVRDDSELRLHF